MVRQCGQCVLPCGAGLRRSSSMSRRLPRPGCACRRPQHPSCLPLIAGASLPSPPLRPPGLQASGCWPPRATTSWSSKPPTSEGTPARLPARLPACLGRAVHAAAAGGRARPFGTAVQQFYSAHRQHSQVPGSPLQGPQERQGAVRLHQPHGLQRARPPPAAPQDGWAGWGQGVGRAAERGAAALAVCRLDTLLSSACCLHPLASTTTAKVCSPPALPAEDQKLTKGAALEKGHFTWITEKGRQERWVVASCGNYTVLWNFRRELGRRLAC